MRYKKGKIQLDIGVPELTLAALLLAAKGKEVLLSALLAASLHEAGHLLMMRLLKKDAAGMKITPFGARIDYQKEQILSYWQDGWIAAAGPAASLLTALVFAFLPSPLLRRTGIVSMLLGIINLLPAKPLDGERIFRALPMVQNNKKSGSLCRSAAFFSILFSYLLSITAIAFGGGNLSPVFFCAYLLFAAIREDQTL